MFQKSKNNFLKKIFNFLIIFYQLTLGTLKGHVCRYNPTCSEYTKIAINRFGAGKGLFLGLKRFLSCHPWSSKPVFDSVPEKLEKK